MCDAALLEFVIKHGTLIQELLLFKSRQQVWLTSISPAGFCLAAGTANKRRTHQAARQRLADGHGVRLKLISI